MMKTKKDLTRGPIAGQMFTMILPMVIGYFAIIAFEFADAWFVSRLGTGPLAAISFVFPVTLVIICIFVGLGIGTGSVVSQAVGRGDRDGARRLAADSLLLCLLLSVVLSVIGIATIKPLFRLLGAQEVIMGDIHRYMLIWYLGAFTVVIPLVAGNCLLAIGDARSTGLINTAGSVLNILFDPLLIFGFGFIPGMGMVGAALATVGARVISSSLGLYLLVRRRRMLSFTPLSLTETLKSWRRILSIGFPASFLHISGPLAFSVLLRISAGFGVGAVAAVGAGMRVDPFILLPFWAVSDVMVVFTGQNYGRRIFTRIRRALKLSWLFCLAFGALCFLPLFFGGTSLGKLFSSDPEVIAKVAEYFRFMPLSYGAVGIIFVTGAVFNGMNRPFRGAAVTLLHIFVFLLPLSLLGGKIAGLPGVFAGFALSSFVGAGIGVTWLSRVIRHLSSREGE